MNKDEIMKGFHHQIDLASETIEYVYDKTMDFIDGRFELDKLQHDEQCNLVFNLMNMMLHIATGEVRE